MALFGSRETFAIETTCLPLVPGELYRFGTFSLLVHRTRIGNPLYQVTLNDIEAGLGWWRETIGQRNSSALMHADTRTAFLSIESALYGLDHLVTKLPSNLHLILVDKPSRFEVLEVDGLEDYRIYCIEDDAITRMLIADAEHDIRDYRVPRADFSAAVSATIEQLERWLAPTSESAGHNDA